MGHKWISFFAVLLVVVAFIIQQRRQRDAARRQQGCEPLVQHQPVEPLYALDFHIGIHKDVSSLHGFHQRYGHTFQVNTLASVPAIATIAPENLRLINSRDDDWGVQPYRLPDMEFFCGRGFLTMDGDFLKTSLHFVRGISADNEQYEAPSTSEEFVHAFHDSLFLTMVRIMLGRAWKIVPQGRYLRACDTAHTFLNFYVDLAMRGTEDPEDRQRPRVKSLVRTEVLGKGDAILEFDALLNSKVLQNVLLESLRLYPIFPLLGRVALRDIVLPTGGGPNHDSPIFVPKGTKVEIGYHALHRDPRVFGGDIEAFRPERWDSIKPGQWEFMAFGGGGRSCLGRHKSLAEASYVLARMAMRLEKLENRDDSEWKGEMKLTCNSAETNE